MYEVYINVSNNPHVYEWESVGKFRNRIVAHEKCQQWRDRGFWAIVEDPDYRKELNQAANRYKKRYSAELKSWHNDSYGSGEVYAVRMESVYEAYNEYMQEREYW